MVTLAEVMQDAGYRTASTGKWSLGDEGATCFPNEQGFDHFWAT